MKKPENYFGGDEDGHGNGPARYEYDTLMRLQKEQTVAYENLPGFVANWQKDRPVYLAIFIDITDVTELRRMQKS